MNTADVLLPDGYHIEVIAQGLNYPTALALDDKGGLYVTEAGYVYGEIFTTPRLLKLQQNKPEVIYSGDKNGPWTGLTFHDGAFYISEGGQMEGGKILRVTPNGKATVIVDSLPGQGDHHTNNPVIWNGYIYFGQGTATNSGVVGPDNVDFGWLTRFPKFHDLPCEDIKLAGVNYESANHLGNGKAFTGAYMPFNTASQPGQVIKGCIPCSGAILKVPIGGGKMEVVAWGLRNPYGLAVDKTRGKLYVAENAADNRGSRPIFGAPDVLWEIKPGTWYGWPDYVAGLSLKDHKGFKAPGSRPIQAVLQSDPGEVPKPAARLGVHSSSNGTAFSTSDAFGFKGEAFVAQFGDMAPNVGKVLAPVGFKVVRVNPETGVVTDFIINKGKKNGPASWQGHHGLERPVSVTFSEDGKSMYVVDFGIMLMHNGQVLPKPNTGVIWKITKKS
ncbi:PQQ-dependent sugar dehydrogenase [Chitinophaga horti]|uniref:PQQ-dependent sugar dehydrogenase n=1 Tax=Chitinophaga horti TaxID=2920382 RepID=A0ABY6J359_9BACT|nr:PQQ-dependent sugar dehydrogenase [Chitinophaga horti]UYQ94099.1 PQQ-dependent sugar dehydrogenase [Chitinophaga horti]